MKPGVALVLALELFCALVYPSGRVGITVLKFGTYPSLVT